MKFFVLFAMVFSSHLWAEDDVSKRLDDFEACLQGNAEALDDRLSPAVQVARVVALECSRQWDRVLALSADRSASRRLHLMNEFPSQQVLDSATKAVLVARRRPQ